MHMLQSLFYLTTALYVSGVTFTHLQEHKTTVTTASGNCYTVLFVVCCYRGRVGTDLSVLWVAYTPPTTSLKYSVTVIRCCSYSCLVLLKMGDNIRNM